MIFQRWPRVAYFALGIVVFSLCGWLNASWYEVANGVLGLNVIHSTRPRWLQWTMHGLTWLPWVVLLVLIVVRIRAGSVARPVAYALGGVTVYLSLVGFLLFAPAVEDWWHRQEFEPTAWRRNDQRNGLWPARLTMVDDLLARHLLRGLTRDSVEKLLGPGDSTTYFRDWDLVYWLGPERGFLSLDSEWLVVRLDGASRVSEHRLVTD